MKTCAQTHSVKVGEESAAPCQPAERDIWQEIRLELGQLVLRQTEQGNFGFVMLIRFAAARRYRERMGEQPRSHLIPLSG
jgi:hypothetical protein